MGQEERCDVLNASFWYFLDPVMQNALRKANSGINAAKKTTSKLPCWRGYRGYEDF